MSNLLGLLVFSRFFPERILILNTDTSVFLAYWYWYLFSILQIEYWYWYFSIWKSYWILNTSIFILYWSGLCIEYWAFHCTDSFSMDWITVKFIGCGVTVFSANTSVFLSNSGQILTFQKPLLLHMCPVMSWSCLGNTTAQFLMLL